MLNIFVIKILATSLFREQFQPDPKDPSEKFFLEFMGANGNKLSASEPLSFQDFNKLKLNLPLQISRSVK